MWFVDRAYNLILIESRIYFFREDMRKWYYSILEKESDGFAYSRLNKRM